MRRGWIPITCGALLVASLVLAVLNVQPPGRALPDLTLRDSGGNAFELLTLKDQVWIASFVSRSCLDRCTATLDRLSQLAEEMPERTVLVTFVLDAQGAWPPRPKGAEGHPRWILCQGNKVDADPEEKLLEFATDDLGIEASRLDALASGGTLAVTVDRLGRPRRVRDVAETDPAPRALRAVVGDAFFLVSLNRHPALHAMLNGTTALLLVAGLFCIRRRLIGAHLTCMISAVAVTCVFLLSYVIYHFNVGSMPFRGTGWSRPLYFGILLSHSLLAAFIVPLAVRMLWLAYRQDFDHHRALGRFALPIWLYVSCTGVLVYCMLYVWFPGTGV